MEQLDRMSLEDKVFAGDASMTSAKNKMLIRDTKKELMRYAPKTHGGILKNRDISLNFIEIQWILK